MSLAVPSLTGGCDRDPDPDPSALVKAQRAVPVPQLPAGQQLRLSLLGVVHDIDLCGGDVLSNVFDLI